MNWRTARTFVVFVLPAMSVMAGAACTQKAADATKARVDHALDATKSGANAAVDATKAAGDKAADAVQKTAVKTAEAAGNVAEKTKDAAAATSSAVTDPWITGKLKAKFADETVLRGSHINIDTNRHVVTLTGTVLSVTAVSRAAAIAGGTVGVTGVINQLVVR